jgi:hypothetical protein
MDKNALLYRRITLWFGAAALLAAAAACSADKSDSAKDSSFYGGMFGGVSRP